MFDVSSCCDCLTAASASPEPLTAFPGKEVALSCWNSTLVDETSYRGRWIKNLTSEVIFVWPNKPLQAEKVEWKADGKGNMCVFLKNLDQSDDGIYTEEVWKGWILVQEKYIRLKVKGNFYKVLYWSLTVVVHLIDVISFQIVISFSLWRLHRAPLQNSSVKQHLSLQKSSGKN